VIESNNHIPLELIGQIHARHASALGRLQLLAEVARLGRDYVPILRMIDDGKPGIPALAQVTLFHRQNSLGGRAKAVLGKKS
jgi:hypothetical protein